jgi:hypothetical protein
MSHSKTGAGHEVIVIGDNPIEGGGVGLSAGPASCNLCPKDIQIVTRSQEFVETETNGQFLSNVTKFVTIDDNGAEVDISIQCCEYLGNQLNGDVDVATWVESGPNGNFNRAFCKANFCNDIVWNELGTTTHTDEECCRVANRHWFINPDADNTPRCYKCHPYPRVVEGENSNLYVYDDPLTKSLVGINQECCKKIEGTEFIEGGCYKKGCSGVYTRYIDEVSVSLDFSIGNSWSTHRFNWLSLLDFHIAGRALFDNSSCIGCDSFNYETTLKLIEKTSGFADWDGITNETKQNYSFFGEDDCTIGDRGDFSPETWLLKPNTWTSSWHGFSNSQQWKDFYDIPDFGEFGGYNENNGVDMSSNYIVYELTIKDLDCNYTTVYRLNIGGNVPSNYDIPTQTHNIQFDERVCVGRSSDSGWEEYVKFGLVSEGPSI